MPIEEKEIGLGLELGKGNFIDTELDNGVLKLKRPEDSTNTYLSEGTWTSGVIDLQHKFKEFKKVALDKVVPPSSQVAIEVRTSTDNINFTEFIATAPDGSFLLPAKRYIEVRLTLYVGHTEVDDIVDLTSEQVVKDKVEKPYYFETNSTGMKITEDPEIPMELDDEYTGEGFVYVAELEKDEFITETITKLDIT